MTKRIIIGAIVALLVLTAMPVVAQHTGQTLTIGGLVPLRLDLTLTPAAAAQDLPLEGPVPAEGVTVADLTISTNNSAGWDLFAYSVNGSRLLNSAAGGNRDSVDNFIDYQVAFWFDGELAADQPLLTIPVGQGDGGLARLIARSNDSNDIVAAVGTLRVDFTPSTDFRAGYYSDQLAVVLRAR